MQQMRSETAVTSVLRLRFPTRLHRMLGTLSVLGVVSWAASGCAVSQVQQLDLEPRSLAIEGRGYYHWESQLGWVRPEEGSWGPSSEVWVESRQAFDAGAYPDALAGFLVLQGRRTRAAPGSKELNFYTAECYYHLGWYGEAVEYYRPVYRKDYPSKELIDLAQRRVYDISIAYLEKRCVNSLLGFTYTSPKTGIDLLLAGDGLVQEYPMLPYADDALREVADYYFEGKEYPEAVPLYDRIAELEGDEWKELAEYRAALCEFLQVRGVDYDEGKIQEAERRFQRYLQRHNRGEYAEKAREKIREIAEMEGSKNLRIAKFYLRESQPRACEIYLRHVVEKYPNSTAAGEAREIREKLGQQREPW